LLLLLPLTTAAAVWVLRLLLAVTFGFAFAVVIVISISGSIHDQLLHNMASLALFVLLRPGFTFTLLICVLPVN